MRAFFLFIFALPLFAFGIEKFHIKTTAPENKELEICLRIPKGYSPADAQDYRIMVLFGGRNWQADKTIKAYRFAHLANEHKLFLVSFSFKNDDYWHPENWSGKAMLEAIDLICKKYGVDPNKKRLYYGYSAGGQCANLFTEWKPEIVDAWAAHACGVWHKPKKALKNIPALITCGEDDTQRYLLSRKFIQEAREMNYSIAWKSYPTGHGLNQEALTLAEAFFESILAPDRKILYASDDQAERFYPIDSRQAKRIDIEEKSVFYSKNTAKLWQEK